METEREGLEPTFPSYFFMIAVDSQWGNITCYTQTANCFESEKK